MVQPSDCSKNHDKVLEIVGRITAAYLSNPNHSVERTAISEIVQLSYSAVMNVDKGAQRRSVGQAPVPIEESVKPDYIICLEDGKKLKMLKRHLRTSYGLTPERYRERWNLPVDYPMVAPNYAKKRSSLAKANELGRARSRVYRHPASAAVAS